MTDPVVNHALRERNHLIGRLMVFRSAKPYHWDTEQGQRDLNQVLAAVDGLVAAELAELREEIALDNKRIAELERVLKAIPGCPDHGELCIPHAMEWIAKALQEQPR